MLSLIILSLIFFSILTNISLKSKKIFVIVSILFIIIFYLFLSLNFFHKGSFCPTKNIKYDYLCSNYYNLLVESFKRYKLKFLIDEIDFENNYFYVNSNEQKIRLSLWDTSVYKNKVYLYFGITPVLLFYLPFNLITGLYLTDKFIVFVLSCLIFLISLFVLKKISENITQINNIPSNIIILSIFLVGFCNLLPFLVVRSAIYEVAITTASFLLLLAFLSFYYYLNITNEKVQYILNFCISLTLCLAVGARPHYVLFIPIFFFFVVWLKYKETKNIKKVINFALIFIIPCLIYGIVIALYNYLRFDSVFEFGWKYQINDNSQASFVLTIKSFIITLKNNLFILPNMDETTVFSLTESFGNKITNESIIGIVWLCPIIIILLFIPHFLKQIYKTNRKLFIFLLAMILVFVVNIIVINCFGIVLRYIFEYLYLMDILSVTMFLFYISHTKYKLLKNFLKFLFLIAFMCSVFINISLLFCKENAIYYITDYESRKCYLKVIKFLF